MADTSNLASRIDAEFKTVAEKAKKFQVEQMEAHQGRQKRLEQLTKTFAELQEVWRPRLEVLLQKFGEHVKVTPRLIPSTREATFEFDSRLARVTMKLAAFTDAQVEKLILSYDLEIVPVLMRFTPHAEIEFPLGAVDKNAVVQWIDDRLIEFVRTYLALGDNDAYLKEFMVEDPIAQVRFPSIAAAATLEWQGKKYHFISDDTRREFAKKNNL